MAGDMPGINFTIAGKIYVESEFAQHGDEQQARYEAMEWYEVFLRTLYQMEIREREGEYGG